MTQLVLASLLAIAQLGTAAGGPGYASIYENGIAFPAFLEGLQDGRSRAAEWKRNHAGAAVADELIAAVRAIPAKRKLLVVADASCSDSVSTIPYVAKLVESAPERLEMRIVNSTAGRAVMEAHRTPDGRAATPTVVVLEEDGRFVGAWSERPANLHEWYAAQKPVLAQAELTSQKMKWYADDAGKSAMAEIVALIAK